MKACKAYNFIQRLVCGLLAAVLCLAPAHPSAHAQEEILLEAWPHVHTDECYSTGNYLVCELEEGPGHIHTDACWEKVRGELWCTDNTGDHIHTDECYAWTTQLTCGMEEGEGAHTHGEECYEQERVLICGQEETAYIDEPEIIEESEEEILLEEIPDEEPLPAPTPTMNPGDGYVSYLQMERELSFAGESDPTADLEDELDWWLMFADLPLTGDWAEDLLRVADSQIG